ncbi:ferritin-like domain-containing protein [Aestuariivita sp.]|jgi:ferritin-like metal-binding protein YciE|uniref:ferritin-like domain-containing protein n=1 Tax=Aestuariivita sp. TaxID=1872407 RepID=UPI002173214C|nr:ferritin-like domain-containing protein [Aestuariivita sp.]MCE8005791.1 ferritin-like domain-containing protein [Aestuariivita sp.]
MSIDTLEDLYLEQLKDIYSANKQALDITKEMAEVASDTDLADALRAGADGIQDGITAIEKISESHDESPSGEHCKGMEGLVQEARAHAIEESFGEDATRDAMIITQYQRLTHYAIAGYGCLAAFADRLELDNDLSALKTCLEASYDGDRTMTALATGGINKSAVA